MPLASALKVMIADDQQTSRLLIRSALSDLGISQVGMAKDGQEALEMILRQPVHLNNYLKKPVSTPELKKKIEAVFGQLQ